MILIPLSGKVAAGRSAIAHSQFADEMMQYRWHCNHYGYACRSVRYTKSDGRSAIRAIFMHSEVLRLAGVEIPDGQEADHINGDTLDNRWPENLRVGTRSQNHANSKPQGGTSRYKGVCWHKHAGKWVARITHNGKPIYIGLFTNEVEAAKAYDEAARRLFGEYARCNFPIEQEASVG